MWTWMKKYIMNDTNHENNKYENESGLTFEKSESKSESKSETKEIEALETIFSTPHLHNSRNYGENTNSKYNHDYSSKNPLNEDGKKSDYESESDCESENEDQVGLSIDLHPLSLEIPLTAESKSPIRPGTPMPKQMKYGSNGSHEHKKLP